MKFDLETILYLLFIVGVFLYNTFMKARKKRAEEQEREQGGEKPAEDEPAGPFGEVWEEWGFPTSGGEGKKEEPAIPEEAPFETRQETFRPEEPSAEPVMMEQLPAEVAVMPAVAQEQTMSFRHEPIAVMTGRVQPLPVAAGEIKDLKEEEAFDLQKAVIYSEVLNRKYF